MPVTIAPFVKIGDLPWTAATLAQGLTLDDVQGGLPRLPRDGRELLHWIVYVYDNPPLVYRVLAQGPEVAAYPGALVVPLGTWPTSLRFTSGDELIVRPSDDLTCS